MCHWKIQSAQNDNVRTVCRLLSLGSELPKVMSGQHCNL